MKYLYTLGKREENGTASYYYVVDGAAADVAEDDFSPYGTAEETHYEGMLQAFEKVEPVRGELTQDEYGEQSQRTYLFTEPMAKCWVW